MQSTLLNSAAFDPDDTPVLRRPNAHPGALYGEFVGRCAHCDRTIDFYTGGQWTHFDGPKCDPRLVAEWDECRIEETLRELRVEDFKTALKLSRVLLNEGFGPVDSARRAALRLQEAAHKAVA